MKSVKALSLLTLVSLVSGLRADIQFSVDPSKAFDNLTSVTSKPATMILAAVAAVCAEVANGLAQRDYDDKGCYRTVGVPQDPVMGDALYSLSQGMGYVVCDQLLFQSKDLTFNSAVQKSVVAASVDWLINKASRTQVFSSINRNMPGLRWLPWNLKFDDNVKKFFLIYVANKAVDSALGQNVTALAA